MKDSQNNTEDFDIVQYLDAKNTKKSCFSWKWCCVATSLTWLLTTVAFATTVGILASKNYIIIDFNDTYNQTSSV